MNVAVWTNIYIYIYIYRERDIYIYIYICREREKERDMDIDIDINIYIYIYNSMSSLGGRLCERGAARRLCGARGIYRRREHMVGVNMAVA